MNELSPESQIVLQAIMEYRRAEESLAKAHRDYCLASLAEKQTIQRWQKAKDELTQANAELKRVALGENIAKRCIQIPGTRTVAIVADSGVQIEEVEEIH